MLRRSLLLSLLRARSLSSPKAGFRSDALERANFASAAHSIVSRGSQCSTSFHVPSPSHRARFHASAGSAYPQDSDPTRTSTDGGKVEEGEGEDVCLVQGASRGIGLEFVRQLLSSRPGCHVIATCRDPDNADQLVSLSGESGGRLSLLPLDVTNENSIKEAANSIESKFGKLNLLVNASGVLHIPKVLQPETSFARVDPNSLSLCYSINAMGPFLVSKHMVPLLKKGAGKGNEKFSTIASLSARIGSISDNSLGGWYSYRASKSALNQLMRCMSIEMNRRKDPIANILLHPGTVDTDLSKPFQRNVPKEKLFTKEHSVSCLLKIIDDLELSDNGKFYAYDGSEIPW